jgi:hypothetical protein
LSIQKDLIQANKKGALGLSDDQWLIMSTLGLSAALLFQLLLFQYGRDQGIFAVVADFLVRGGVPYRDVWDFKTPGIYFVYALARMLFGGSMLSVRILEVVGLISLVYAFAVFSKRHLATPVPGILGGALAILAHLELEFWHTAQPESFGAIILSWALVCSTYEARPRDRRMTIKQMSSWVGAGILFAFAFLLKPPLGGCLVVSLGIIMFRRWRRSDGEGRFSFLIRPALAMGLGAAVVLSLTILFFVWHGAWDDLHRVFFVFLPEYTSLSSRNIPLLGAFFHALSQWLFSFSLINAVGLGLLFVLPSVSSREGEGIIHLLGYGCVQLVGIAAQAKFFPYHYGGILPFAGLLAGWGLYKIYRISRAKWIFAVCLLLLVWGQLQWRPPFNPRETYWERFMMRFASLLEEPEERHRINDYLHCEADVNAGTNRQAAEWIAGHTPADAKIYIWGFEPAIYDLSHRRPASRYIYNVPQRIDKLKTEYRRILMEELDSAVPAVIVVEKRDIFPWVTGNTRDSQTELSAFPELAELLNRKYERAVEIEDLTIYCRKKEG